MYYESYEEYMRNMQRPSQNPYVYDVMPTYNYNNQEISDDKENLNRNMEGLYPDLYRKVYPLVRKVCKKNARNLDADILEELTSEVFVQLENERQETAGGEVKLEPRISSGINTNSRSKDEKNQQSRQTRQRNPILHDLIRILIIREFIDALNSNNCFSQKPQKPCPPPRPYPQRPCSPRQQYCRGQIQEMPFPYMQENYSQINYPENMYY